MKFGAGILFVSIALVACTTPDIIEIQESPTPPTHWNPISTTKLDNSDCPIIEGVYSESDYSFSSSKTNGYSKTPSGSYFRFFPFHIAEESELTVDQFQLSDHEFAIRQPDASRLVFFYKSEKRAAIIESEFQSFEGDFECKHDYLEFPINEHYGMIEGRSLNVQVRNRITMDVSGALIVQSTFGPYRGNPSRAAGKFTHEYYRFQPVGQTDKL